MSVLQIAPVVVLSVCLLAFVIYGVFAILSERAMERMISNSEPDDLLYHHVEGEK